MGTSMLKMSFCKHNTRPLQVMSHSADCPGSMGEGVRAVADTWLFVGGNQIPGAWSEALRNISSSHMHTHYKFTPLTLLRLSFQAPFNPPVSTTGWQLTNHYISDPLSRKLNIILQPHG